MLISLNLSTLRGHKLALTQMIDIAAACGYQGIEPWPDDLDAYEKNGGTLKDLSSRLKDKGLAVTGAIHWAEWMVDDPTARARGVDDIKRMMEKLSQIGATHVAAPPKGDVEHVELLAAAERYRKILEASEDFAVTPVLELWGFAPNLFRLGQVAYVALEADHPKACILPDVYHLFRGGSGFGGISRLRGSFYGGFHMNDIPRDHPPREQMTDADRVYPGDGIAPLVQLFRDLREIQYSDPISIELFNPDYYKQDPMLVAKTAIDKTQHVMAQALEPGSLSGSTHVKSSGYDA